MRVEMSGVEMFLSRYDSCKMSMLAVWDHFEPTVKGDFRFFVVKNKAFSNYWTKMSTTGKLCAKQ